MRAGIAMMKLTNNGQMQLVQMEVCGYGYQDLRII